MNINPDDLNAADFEISAQYYTDGKVTQALIMNNEEDTIGEGIAKRRPGDTRNEAVGALVALERALRDAANTVAARIADHWTGKARL